ncbi:MAG: hypothetical protein D6731_25540 [Planctomycetota bacterium]|nr:MAG: hypothetical protein D6731_25540 [Planctomycetota bacterium]
MRLRPLPISFVLCLAGAVLPRPAAAEESVVLKRLLAKGTRVEVEDRRRSQSTILYRTRHDKVGVGEEKLVVQRYVEEVRRARPELLWREYSVSTEAKGRPRERVEPVRTSLHGQRVFLEAFGMRPDGAFEIEKEDRERLRLERLVYALLPPQETVRVRESWTVGPEPLKRALFGPLAVILQKESGGKATLRSLKKEGNRQVAVLRVRTRLRTEVRADFPGVDLNLKGEVKWAVTEGLLLEANLAGPMTFTSLGKDRERMDIQGNLAWTYRAKILAVERAQADERRERGAPPPPGTRVLVCTLHPKEHRIELRHYPMCPLCGQPLDPDRACPRGDPFPFQYCPHDGAPLQPE